MEELNSPSVVNDSGAELSEPNVAIIAIHGVGAHLSGASAEAVSTLLTSMGRDTAEKDESNSATSPYSGFVARSIGVPLRQVQAPPEGAQEANYRQDSSWVSRLWSIFDERRGYLAKARKNAQFVPFGYKEEELRPGEPDRGEFGYQFMLTQVAGYKGEPDRSFQTVRLEGKRAPNSPAATVHIYDAHYSDLTKPQSNILSFFLAFYQLLFHLASLSLLAVYWAEAENAKANTKRVWRWRIKSSVNATSVRLLTMWVPALNLILLAIASSALIDRVRPASGGSWVTLRFVAFGVAAFLSLVATFVFTRKGASPSRPFLWAAIPFVGAGLGTLFLSGLACLYSHLPRLAFSEALLVLCWLVAAALVLAWIANIFEPLRPGVFLVTIVLYAANVLFFLGYLLPEASKVDNRPIATASLWAVQWIFAELSVCWILCLLFALVSWPLGALCILGIDKSDTPRKARARAAFRTGRFAFAVPAVLFMIVTCALWSGVVVYGSNKLKVFDGVSLCAAQSGLSSKPWASYFIPPVNSVLKWMEKGDVELSAEEKEAARSAVLSTCKTDAAQRSFPWFNYLKGLLLVSVTPGLPLTVTTLALSLLLLTWAVLPSVVFEIKPEWTKNAATERIRGLGEWLSRGLDNTAILTRLLWFGIVLVPLVFFAIDWLALQRSDSPSWITALYSASKLTLPLISWTGLGFAISGAAVFGLMLKYLTSVLDTLLDIDNYLRTSPLDQTPRARIAERCVSLLRYIAAYQDEQGRPYSKVIIVAHSLGSMVTTDLLRYLERSAVDSPDPGLARYGFRRKPTALGQPKLPICVFSMGSPLRQLLNRFFPHLYWWVSDVPDNSLAALGDPVGPPIPAIRIPTLPRMDEMNVHLWVNAYRSGDYIGRSLWIGQWLERNSSGNPSCPADIARAGRSPSCAEMCIGLGAHTHYWDRTAPDVAALLDQLITQRYVVD